MSQRRAVPADKGQRQEAVRRLIASRRVSTQQELVELLAAEGVRVTQATLSRDLVELGASRVARPEGTFYWLDPLEPTGLDGRAQVADLVLSIEPSAALVVMRTRPGSAPAVALVIDVARLPQCLGTVAGDDTIFAAAARGVSTDELARALSHLFSRDGARAAAPLKTPRLP